MTKFIKKLSIFALIIFIGCFCIVIFSFFVIGSQYKYNYLASFGDKVARLENIEEPKIILVGNSNLSFGIDSKRIEDALGMPVVNLGLHGGLGNAFHEEMAKFNINTGDIVVVCHSSFSDKDEIDDREMAWITIDNNIELGRIIRRKDCIGMLTAYPNYVRKAALLWLKHYGNKDAGGCYSRNAFNEYGDVVHKPDDGQMDVDALFATSEIKVPEINNICTNRLNEYNEYILESGATMVIAGYPIAYGEYATFSEDEFISFKARLQEALDCEVISDYTDYFYPYDYFYNSSLHLTTTGAEARTEQLITDLNKWMSR